MCAACYARKCVCVCVCVCVCDVNPHSLAKVQHPQPAPTSPVSANNCQPEGLSVVGMPHTNRFRVMKSTVTNHTQTQHPLVALWDVSMLVSLTYSVWMCCVRCSFSIVSTACVCERVHVSKQEGAK